MAVVARSGKRLTGKKDSRIIADSVVDIYLIGGIDMHDKRNHAIDTMVSHQVRHKGIGGRHAVPCKRGQVVVAQRGVDSVRNIGPHMQMIGHHTVTPPLVREGYLYHRVGRQRHAIILPGGSLILGDRVEHLARRAVIHHQREEKQTVAPILVSERTKYGSAGHYTL